MAESMLTDKTFFVDGPEEKPQDYTIYAVKGVKDPTYRGALTGFSPIGEVMSTPYTIVVV